ncbi:MAG: DUF2135 domain-containing protein, partial [Synergistaceae bacterium]|nr:DUF2135 domain-containing protein [Synergistaceae bacterium]
RLVTRGADRPIELRGLDITSNVAGGYAWTTVEMTFFNPNSRVLEGELQFPLADGQTITGFALSIGEDKKEVMRDAVPVEKQRGRQVLESIVRQGVDPALLEVTQGNNFKLRVYPLNPGGTRRVRLTYSELVPSRGDDTIYRLPLSYFEKVGELSVEVTIAGAERISSASAPGGMSPEVRRKDARGIELPSSVVTLSGHDVSLDGEALSVTIPRENRYGVLLGTREGKTYFNAFVPRPPGSVRKLPRSVSILWDASMSGSMRNHGLEFDLLDKLFTEAGDVSVDLQRARNVADERLEFDVRGGDWSALRKAIESTVYDGATNLGAFDTGASSEAYFLFSDGLDNYSVSPLEAPEKPLYAFVSSLSANFPRLRRLSRGGEVINLAVTGAEGALEVVAETRSRLVDIEGRGLSDVLWQTSGADSYIVTGIVQNGELPASLILETPDGRHETREITLKGAGDFRRDEPNADWIPHLWASMKIESLDAEYDLNRGEIRRLGKAFGIATRETSLLVLENASDYVMYDIDPPSELKAECDKLRASGESPASSGEQNKVERVLQEWREREEWWKKDFPKGKMPKQESKDASLFDELAADEIPGGNIEPVLEMRSISLAAPSAIDARQDDMEQSRSSQGTDITIGLRPWSPDEPYIRRMREARDEDLYRVYLDERPDYENSAAFYLDVSYQLLERGKTDLSLRVLSNLAEMDLENRQILRVLGYRLLEAGLNEEAVMIFRRVLLIADDEPQSHRDLGLALVAAGNAEKYQEAINRLYDAAIRTYDRRFPGIEVIAITEMNAIIANASSKLDTSGIDPRFIANLQLDLRVVLTWDSDNTDIDLHVTDPNGEEAYYGNRLTYQGGRSSPDNTSGYGPEEFSLKTAKPGKYRVDVNFYGHTQQVISESTTIQLDFFTRYGTGEQKKQSVTMRLKDANNRIFVGEFEVR